MAAELPGPQMGSACSLTKANMRSVMGGVCSCVKFDRLYL